MYEVKNKIFFEFTKTQKSAICNFLKNLTKKFPDFEVEELLQKFLEDEKYYLQMNVSRFEFLKDFIEDENFIYEARLYLKECKKYYEYKKSQLPLIEEQKEFKKKKRKFFQELKMSKELPTKKQLSYYKSLCKKYNMEMGNLEDLSKLELKKAIEEIINEYQRN